MNLFSQAYRNSGTIRGTTFEHGDESYVYKSPLNTFNLRGKGPRASLARPIAEAIVSLFDDTILGIGLTDNNMVYVECTPVVDRSKTYQILYSPDDSLPVIQMYSKELEIDVNFASRHMFIPILVDDIYHQKDKEMLIFLEGLREIFNREGLPFKKEDDATSKYFFLMNDYFYFLHKGINFGIAVDPSMQIKIEKDITKEIIGRDSDFRIVKGPKVAKNQTKRKRKTAAKIDIPSIDFGEPLSQEMLERIPDLPDWMQVPEKLIPVEKSLASGRVISVLQYGRTGGGKTTNVELMCRDIRLPLVAIVNCTNNLDEFILGKYIPQGSEFVFFESAVTEAIEWGGAVLFDEINFGNPKHMSFLHSLLDNTAMVRLDNGREVKRHPCFRFFANMNIGYAGTTKLNKALFRRFNAKIRIDDLSDEQIKALLMKKAGIKAKTAEDMLVVYRKIQTKIEEEQREEVICPEDILNWAKQTTDSDERTAAEYTVVAIAEEDDYFAEELRDIIKMKF